MSNQSPHYTHSLHAQACRKAAEERKPLQAFVQVNYEGKASVCAKVVDAWDGPRGKEMWKLNLIGEVKGFMSFPTSQVRQCSNLDGKCQCAKEFALPSTNG